MVAFPKLELPTGIGAQRIFFSRIAEFFSHEHTPERGHMRDRRIPYWPRRMKLQFAAAYVDESQTKFLAGVKAKKWPAGTRDGGNVYWFIEDLDTALDLLKTVIIASNYGWDDYIGQS
jgi:hypothetical protein